MKKMLILFLFYVLSIPALSQNPKHTVGSFSDPRDGRLYKTISFKRFVDTAMVEFSWFAENLQYDSKNSHCYKNIRAYCRKYGKLYDFASAQKVCPQGWHLPTISDWNQMVDFFGGKRIAPEYILPKGEGDMDMLYGGFGDPNNTFIDVGRSGNWWFKGLSTSNPFGVLALVRDSPVVHYDQTGENFKISVRCMKGNL